MSAIKFEQGDYPASLTCLNKAWSLLEAESDDSPKKQKVLIRMAKCQLHLLAFNDASNSVKALGDGREQDSLRSSLSELKKLWVATPDTTTLQKQILDRLARYKTAL